MDGGVSWYENPGGLKVAFLCGGCSEQEDVILVSQRRTEVIGLNTLNESHFSEYSLAKISTDVYYIIYM